MINAIFIIGTGRSGTHFLCRTLLGFENINDMLNGHENSPLLNDITISAIEGNPLSNSVINYYKDKINNNFIFLDQHHPNIHHYDQLSKEFPNALFVGIDRPIEQIVSSMLIHGGVLKWFEKAKANLNTIYPNNFLGVSSASELDEPKHILAAKRVLSHKNIYSCIINNSNFRLLNFENLIYDREKEFNRVFSKEELQEFGNYLEKEKPNIEVLTKFKKNLTNTQLSDIL